VANGLECQQFQIVDLGAFVVLRQCLLAVLNLWLFGYWWHDTLLSKRVALFQ
jgi:hypothetical protein